MFYNKFKYLLNEKTEIKQLILSSESEDRRGFTTII